MTDLETARRRWLAEQPQFKQFGMEIKSDLEREISRAGMWADVSTRPKEMDSLIRKLIRKPAHTYDTLGDKAGVRVIVRYKDDVTPILAVAETVFQLSDLENTADRLRPETVGYLSVHSTVRLRAQDSRAQSYPPTTFFAELQIRTLAQHLWAEMAHGTVYKNDETLQPLSNELKRRVYIMAGAIELADEEFNRIEREMPTMPELEILRALERHHFKLTTRRSDLETSLDVIRLLAPLYNLDTGRIIAHLDGFYLDHEATLRTVFELAEVVADKSAFLFQPESLIIYDLLESDSLAVRKTWNTRYPEKELERFANAFGMSFD